MKMRKRSDPEYRVLPNGCWEWLGATIRGGYGHKWYKGKVTTAHRAYFQIVGNHVGPKDHVDHLCRYKRCVNPDHLEVVTAGENHRRGLIGKLSHNDIRRVRELARQGVTYRKIAKIMGTCSGGHISNIVNRVRNGDVR